MKKRVKAYPETHQQGFLSVEATLESSTNCDFGIQIADDGRVWICVNGQAFLRFKPREENKAIDKFWRCEECGYKNYQKPMPKDRNKFYSRNRVDRCPYCKSEAFMPVGY